MNAAEDLIADMNNIRLGVYDAVKAEDTAETRRRLGQWRSQIKKLPTSVQIRFGDVDETQLESVDEVLYSLETLEQYVLAGKFREARAMTRYVEKVYGACRDEFRQNDVTRNVAVNE